MSNLAVDEAQAVVFVSNRAGAALRRRERCLKLAGIAHGVQAERRPSGTYYKLCVRENDAVAAHLALQMGGCGRTVKLQDPSPASSTPCVRSPGRLSTRSRCSSPASSTPSAASPRSC